MTGKYRSSSKNKMVVAYLKPREYMMFTAEKDMMLRGTSEHGKEIIEAHYRAMAPSHQQQLLDHYNYKIEKKTRTNP